ncbi:LacI family DNA-binding transcriptional regulator [Solwaraspora sp. WMMD1047]|nr:LacI family DNA-binding transcriptional regulator [Solwaraspora sp. WMMD1047]MDG4830127.1 LacI family DNA-binding transcriptional regulator [Solwaraspora sp. WMMD1047]
MADAAARAGVSKTTVSRVLDGRIVRVDDDTQRRTPKRSALRLRDTIRRTRPAGP